MIKQKESSVKKQYQVPIGNFFHQNRENWDTFFLRGLNLKFHLSKFERKRNKAAYSDLPSYS